MPQVTLKKQNEVVIAATSDLHGYLEGIKQVCDDNKVDILIIAGDIQPADIQYHCNDTACGHWFRNKFFNLIKKLKCEVVAIPGNHDFWLRSLIYKKPPDSYAESLVQHRNRAGIDTASEKMVYYEQEEPVPEVAKALCEEKTAQNATGYDTRHRPKWTLAAGLGQRPNRRGESLRQAPASSAAVVDGNFGTPEERKEKFFIPDNFHLLAESEVTIKGLRIYGTPWVPWINGRWCFEGEEKELVRKWNKIPEGIDILVTHTPPRYDNHNIDVSLERDPNAHRHFGSYSLADRIREVNPSLVFCGHIHSGDHKCHVEYKKDAPHGNFVWNVSRVNERYFIGYPIRVVRFGEKTVIEREKDSLAIE